MYLQDKILTFVLTCFVLGCSSELPEPAPKKNIPTIEKKPISANSKIKLEDRLELSCPDGEPLKANMELGAKQRLRMQAKKKKCTVNESTFQIGKPSKPNGARKCSVEVSAFCK